ncbi:hypothetical protein N7456_003219 [Penicillium angulare]|uniref:Uncharacterized protein n=1 Tax=Penicillium angulare TaxID=116970 RepID=A0A9W9KHB4_9EURO|nr:hypothetical protein N7456_003219 [Penicillium angulare]
MQFNLFILAAILAISGSVIAAPLSGRDDPVKQTLEGVSEAGKDVVKDGAKDIKGIIDEGSGDVFAHVPNLDQSPKFGQGSN